jgi:voltage-gated potassium channel
MSRPSRQLLLGSGVFVCILVLAVFGYVAIDHVSVLDAFYMVVLTIFGVGYEEAVPVDSKLAKIFTILVIVSGCTTLLYILGAFIQVITEGQIRNLIGARKMTKELSRMQDHVIVCGFGRLGRMLAKDLHDANRDFVVLEKSEQRIDEARTLGYVVFSGDATDEKSLREVGVDRAKTLATVLPNDAANVFITLSAVDLNPSIEVIARGEEPSTERKLLQAGARRVVLPAHIGAERIAQMILFPSAADYAESSSHTRHLNEELLELGVHMEELPIHEGSPHVGASIGEIELSGEGSFLVVALRRGETLQSKPDTATRLEAGDQLIVLGHADSSAELTRKSAPASYHYRGAKT